MRYFKFAVFIFLTLFAHSVFAYISNSNSSLSYLREGQVVLEVGAYQGIQGTSQHVGIQSLIGDYFTVSDRNNYNGLVGLGYFINNLKYKKINLSYGLNAFYLAPVSVFR